MLLTAMPPHATPFDTAGCTARDEQRWEALQVRRRPSSATAAEDFLYGVTSTGVVCRPECPSKLPRRSNVRFFDSLEHARSAGFRPCLRCRPDGISPQVQLSEKVQRARRHLDRADAPVSLAELAEIAGMSPFHLQRSFRAELGLSPAEYARSLRAQRFADALERGAVTDAIYAAGFRSASAAYNRRTNPLGMTPGDVRRGGEHRRIRYSIADSPLGRMLVAATDRGVCSIAFGEGDDELGRELRERFPAAELAQDHDALKNCVRLALASLVEPVTAERMPLHVRATAFQQRVWAALQAIPRGETRTYSQIAGEIGQPAAARAVARACATNPVAVVVPCHRVVGSDGSLTGYRWGVERKRQLLDLEKTVQKPKAPHGGQSPG